ncbi:MAG: response regulator [Nitrospirae bacterium]|nr:response regulator [Nitrospirota bacterium]
MKKNYMSKSMLIVEDHKDARRILTHHLQQLGCTQVQAVEDGLKAQEVLQREPVDLILSDWKMPGMNGLELLKAVRADESTRHIKVVLITADDDKDRILEALLAGVDGYLVKPILQEHLQQKFEDIFKDE